MPIKVTCPKCQGVLHAPDDAGGKRGKCPTCGTVLSIPAENPVEHQNVPLASYGNQQGSPAGNEGGGGFRLGATSPAPMMGAGAGMTATPGLPGLAVTKDTYGLAGGQGGMSPADALRASGGGNKPLETETRRGSSNRLPPPPSFGGSSQMKANDPFAKPGRASNMGGFNPAADASSWRKARAGLWWVRLSWILFLIPVLGLCGLTIAKDFKVEIPNKVPGFLGNASISSEQEIQAAIVLIPILLGSFTLTIGRLASFTAPHSSFAKGFFGFSALAMMASVGAFAAAIVPFVLDAKGGAEGLAARETAHGLLERAGLLTGATLFILSEVWFSLGLARIGAALANPRLAARTMRFFVLLGILVSAAVILQAMILLYPADARMYYDDYVVKTCDKLGEHRAAIEAGILAFVGLFAWLIEARLVGGARRAIREWVEQNG